MENADRKKKLVSLLARNRDQADTHVHTCFTDGADSVEAMCEAARRNGLSYLVLAEHVSRQPTFDYEVFAGQVRQASGKGLFAVEGCEAKMLGENGDLDLPPEAADQSRLVIASCHRTRPTKAFFLSAVHAALDNPLADVWGHPFSTGLEILPGEWRELCRHARANAVAIDVNEKYPMPSWAFDILKKCGCLYLFGSDAHAAKAVRKAGATPALIKTRRGRFIFW